MAATGGWADIFHGIAAAGIRRQDRHKTGARDDISRPAPRGWPSPLPRASRRFVEWKVDGHRAVIRQRLRQRVVHIAQRPAEVRPKAIGPIQIAQAVEIGLHQDQST